MATRPRPCRRRRHRRVRSCRAEWSSWSRWSMSVVGDGGRGLLSSHWLVRRDCVRRLGCSIVVRLVVDVFGLVLELVVGRRLVSARGRSAWCSSCRRRSLARSRRCRRGRSSPSPCSPSPFSPSPYSPSPSRPRRSCRRRLLPSCRRPSESSWPFTGTVAGFVTAAKARRAMNGVALPLIRLGGTGIVRGRRGFGKGQSAAETAHEKAGDHEAGRRCDLHTRTHSSPPLTAMPAGAVH